MQPSHLNKKLKNIIWLHVHAQNNTKNIKNKLNYETDPLIDQ